MSASCVFNILDTSMRFEECDKKNAKNAEEIKRWENRPALLALVQEGDQQEILRLQDYWKGKIVKKKNRRAKSANQKSQDDL